MCHASLKMALLLHKEGLVKTTVPITVEVQTANCPVIKNTTFICVLVLAVVQTISSTVRGRPFKTSTFHRGGGVCPLSRLIDVLNGRPLTVELIV